MGYIGSVPATNFETVRKQVSTTNSGTTITLDYSVSSVQDILVTVNAVVQSYDNYSVSGTTLTLGGTLNNDRVEILYVGRTFQTVSPAVGTVTLDMLSATGTKDATTFLRGDNTFASAGLSDWSESSGNLLPSNASYGIYLGTSSANAGSSPSNLLNDYEFGTFTPSIAPTSGSFSAVGTQSGFYTKIGNLVHYQCELSVTTNGTGSGSIDVTGLPFTSASTGLVHTVNHGRETQIDGSTFVTIQSVNTTALVMLGPPFGNGAGYSLNGTYRV